MCGVCAQCELNIFVVLAFSVLFCSLVFIDWFSDSVLLVFINENIWFVISLVLDRFSKLLTVSLNSSGPGESLSFWPLLSVFVRVI